MDTATQMIIAMVPKKSFLQVLFIYKWDYKQKMKIVNRPKIVRQYIAIFILLFLFFYSTP